MAQERSIHDYITSLVVQGGFRQETVPVVVLDLERVMMAQFVANIGDHPFRKEFLDAAQQDGVEALSDAMRRIAADDHLAAAFTKAAQDVLESWLRVVRPGKSDEEYAAALLAAAPAMTVRSVTEKE